MWTSRVGQAARCRPLDVALIACLGEAPSQTETAYLIQVEAAHGGLGGHREWCHVVLHEGGRSRPGGVTTSAVAVGFGPERQEALIDVLRTLGDVTLVDDLDAGLATARALRPAMILIAVPPGLDTFDALMAVRHDPELAAVPVVTLTVDLPPPAGEPVDTEGPKPGRGRDHHQVAQALQRMMLDEVMKVSYILASAANSGDETVDRQVMTAISRLDTIAIGLRDAVIDLRRGHP